MIRAIAIDDEQLILDNLTYIFSKLTDATLVQTYKNPVDALTDYHTLHPDVILVDINMPSMNGLEFAERLREIDTDANIIFLTAYEQYAVDAFKVNAVDYILKPVTSSKLIRSLERVRGSKTTPKKEHTLTAPIKIAGMYQNHIYLLDPSDVLYISVSQRSVLGRTKALEYQLKYTISYWEELLKSSGWFRCHRCYLINMNQINEISMMFNNTYDVKFKDCPDVVTVSRTYAAAFKNYLNI